MNDMPVERSSSMLTRRIVVLVPSGRRTVMPVAVSAVIMPVTLGVPLLQFIQQANEFGLTDSAVLVSPIGLPDWLVDRLGKTSTNVISAGSWAAWRYEESWAATKAFNEAFYAMHGRVAGMQSLQSASAALLHQVLRAALPLLRPPHEVEFTLDVDPLNML